jgi:arsenate reductase
MSQALFERIVDGRHETRSAGTTPADRVHPNVVAAMREVGVDLSDRVPRKLNDELGRWADVVVTMGCGDECPVIPGRRYIDWELADPKNLPIADVRRIRDDIKIRVAALVEELETREVDP